MTNRAAAVLMTSLAAVQAACGSTRLAEREWVPTHDTAPRAAEPTESFAAAEPASHTVPASPEASAVEPTTDTAPRGRDAIQLVVRGIAVPGVRACYEAQLGTDGGLSGRVLASFIIEAAGSVRPSPSISSELEPAGPAADAVVECVRGVIERLRFRPDPTGQLVGINYPFVLHSYECEPDCTATTSDRLIPALAQALPATVACLRGVLTTYPDLAGAMNVAITLDGSGRASSVTVAPDSPTPSGEGSERARDCARRGFATLAVGPIETPVVVTTTVAMPRAP